MYAYVKSYPPCPAMHVSCYRRAMGMMSVDHNGEAHWVFEHRLPGANSHGPTFLQNAVCATECLTRQACNSMLSAALPWLAILYYAC